MDTIVRQIERNLLAGVFVSETQLERYAAFSATLSNELAQRRQAESETQMARLYAMTTTWHCGDTDMGRFVTDSGQTVYDEYRLYPMEHNGETIYWSHAGYNANGTHRWERAYRVSGPRRMTRDDTIDAIASLFGVKDGKTWGNKSGTVKLFGITFHLRPKGTGAHRLKVVCPGCGGTYGPAKWRQHYKAKHAK